MEVGLKTEETMVEEGEQEPIPKAISISHTFFSETNFEILQ